MLWVSVTALAFVEPVPSPETTVNLASLGYGGLSAAARQSGGANLSVDFLDAEHVLVTFNPKKLFKRHPECPPSHADRLVHAVVIELPSGKTIREGDWYLHDLKRYAWNLGEGRILLRRLNQLYEVNANLEEKLIYDSPKDFLWVSVTSDGRQIIVETRSNSQETAKTAKKSNDGEPKNNERVSITFLDSHSLAVQRTIEARGAVNLEGTSLGVADGRKQGSNWLVEFGNSNVTRVKSRRPPNLLYTSANTLVVGRCSVSRDGYSLSSFTVTGTFLWRQHWEDCRYGPVARDAEDGSRTAIGTLTIRKTEVEEDTEGLDQHIQVLDTATGKEILMLTASPAVPSGQNFALSPEGRRLAVVADRSLDVYKLPEMSAQERERYVAVKSDTPDLNAPPAQASEKGEAAEPVFVSSANVESTETEGESPVKPAAVPDNKPTSREEVPTLTLRTGTQVVAVDVVVTDSNGRLVKDLPQDAFKVLEDGKAQTVKYFREFSDTRPEPAAAGAPTPPPLPPNVFSNYSQPTEADAVTVVLMDVLNTPIADQAHAQDELVKFLKNKPKDAKIAICVLGNRLQMIQGFTSDNNVLLAAAKGRKASQRQRPLQDPDSVIPVEVEAGRATAQFLGSLNILVESIAQQQSEMRLIDADQRMLVTVDAFAQLARYLSGVPGRKNLVWLSGSFVLGIYPEANGRNPFNESHMYGEEIKKVANLLGDAHVAVYPVDVKGLETNPLFTAASNVLAPIPMSPPPTPLFQSGPRVANIGSAVADSVMMDQLDQFGVQQMDEHSTMKHLADQTGGQAYYNTNGIAQAIHTAAEQGSNYYALSYTPTNRKFDGTFRKIHVTLAGHKYHLAYRSGYYAVDPLTPAKGSRNLMSNLARAAMQQGSPASRQIVFGAKVVPVGKPRIVQDVVTPNPKKSKKKKDKEPLEIQRYAIDHAVTFSDLRFTPTGKGTYHGVVNFMVTAFDKEGELTASELSQSVADLKPEVLQDIMAGGMRVHQEIEVPVKSVSMRIGVEDATNSHIGTLEINLPVPPPPGGVEGTRRPLPAVEPD